MTAAGRRAAIGAATGGCWTAYDIDGSRGFGWQEPIAYRLRKWPDRPTSRMDRSEIDQPGRPDSPPTDNIIDRPAAPLARPQVDQAGHPGSPPTDGIT
ncbi:hypothetical protein Aco03nite_071350 [Actinoplanes couchii]|uniref:Uncharacterized protein n=1 Tax=Actinoplanes couchii TaxID=403638 RepID=A0ABQ3XJQ7_9ACTN|nr:hypothetical protein Aco03nite_071350 [Actinoplanes couchii]